MIEFLSSLLPRESKGYVMATMLPEETSELAGKGQARTARPKGGLCRAFAKAWQRDVVT